MPVSEKNKVIYSRYPNIVKAMRRPIISLCVVALAATSPSLTFASGSASRVPASASRQAADRANFTKTQTLSTNSSQAVVAEEPYNLGKAIFSGKYKFGRPELTTANVTEKMQRIVTVQRTLAASAREKLNASDLSRRLTDHEMNALEYYLRMRFGKFIAKAPSWAKAEPPPKVALAR